MLQYCKRSLRFVSTTAVLAAQLPLTTMAQPAPADFAGYVLEDARELGKKVTLGSLWADKPLSITFLRRLG